jgi:hypothetical protein
MLWPASQIRNQKPTTILLDSCLLFKFTCKYLEIKKLHFELVLLKLPSIGGSKLRLEACEYGVCH